MKPTAIQNEIFSRIKKNTDENTNLYDLNRHRMTYERAAEYFRAMKLLKEYTKIESTQGGLPIGILQDASDIGLVLPDDGKFGSFIDLNADRLQLFDEEPICQTLFIRIAEDGDIINYTICFHSDDIPF
jgi:hypothetical protein